MTSLGVDAEFYRGQVSAPVNDPIRHYRRFGDKLGLNPSPYFDTAYYKAQYPDWAAQGAATALDDYLTHDIRGERRRPHPLIDPADYLQRYPDVAAAGVSPLDHFIRYGDAERRSPSQGFDASYYARCYLPLGDGLAFRHYVELGRKLGHLPKPSPCDHSQSAAAMTATLAGLDRPIILCAHDAQQAGVPLLLRDMAQWFAANGFSPIFILLNGGPIVETLSALGPVFLLAEGWSAKGLFAKVPDTVPVVINSGAAAHIGLAATDAGLRPVILLHEMRGYLDAQALLHPLAQAKAHGAQIVVSFPRMKEELRPDFGTLRVLQPGVRLPSSPLSAFRDRRRAFRGRRLFIGAGHADHRKGFDLFLTAARSIARQMPNARFVWLGMLDPWARALADTALLDGLDLLLPGFVEESLAWYAAADVYLLTSREDPGPTTLVHAAATGTPFVGYAGDIGLLGLVDTLGHFVEPGDEDRLVTCAIKMASTYCAADRHARRAWVRQHLGYSRYCRAILVLAGTNDE